MVRRRAFLIGLAGVALAACTPDTSARPPGTSSELPLIATPARNVWPLAYRQAPAAVQEAYGFAIAQPQMLTDVPCFCGCGAMGHRNNYDCFVKSQTASGAFLLDAHGFGCGSCVAVALDAKAMLARGLSVKAIRSAQRAISHRRRDTHRGCAVARLDHLFSSRVGSLGRSRGPIAETAPVHWG